MPRSKKNNKTEAIRGLIDRRLKERVLSAQPMAAGAHLDEDALAAFVDGRMGEDDSPRVISHLVACTFCRRITAQLVRLESEMPADETTTPQHPPAESRGRLRRLLEELAARVTPASEMDAVFAYHAPAEDFKASEQKDDASEKKSENEE